MKKLVLFSLVTLFAVSCEPEYVPSGFGKLDGNLYLKNESNPLKGFGIRLPGYMTVFTNSEGYFNFSEVPEGVHTFEVLQLLEPIYSGKVGVQSDKLTTVAIFLESIKEELPDFTVVDVSSDVSGWDYWIVGKEECFYIDEENSKPKSLLFHSFKTGKDCAVEFNDQGLPHFIFADDFIFVFDNFNGKKVDVGILFPSGEFKIAREVENDFVWLSPLKSTTLSRAELLRWTGRVAGAIPCVVLGAAAIVSGGFAIPLAVWTCGNYLLKMANSFFEDANVKNGFTQVVKEYHLSSTVYQCSTNPDIASCLIAIANKALGDYADYIEELDKREEQLEKLLLSLENNVDLKSITLQPGLEGKDAWVSLSVIGSNCETYYDHSGNDSVLYMIWDQASIGCSKNISNSFIQFSMSKIPVNATVAYAKLEVYGTATINQSNSIPEVGIYELNTSWNELTTEWIDDYYTEFITSVYFTNVGIYSWYFFDVTSVVQDWVSGEKINYGFELTAYQKTVYAKICSSDNSNSTKRPKLTVYYY